MACNTAHLLLDQLEETLQHKIISLIDMTINEIFKSDLKKVGILASPTTIRSGLYTKPLQAAGVSVVLPTTEGQTLIERMIRQVIAGNANANTTPQLSAIISRMKDDGCEAVVLGCTELSVIMGPDSTKDIIDPLTIAARELVK